MTRVSVEVQNGAARFRVGVQAESIGKALRMVGGRYPRGEARVVVPVDAGVFVEYSSVRAGMFGSGQFRREAA